MISSERWRRLAALPLIAVLASGLAACTPTDPNAVQVHFAFAEPDVSAPTAPLTWYSGVLADFDTVAASVPGLDAIRNAVAADDAAFGEAALATALRGEQAAVAAGVPAGGRGLSRSSDRDAFNNMMIGSLGPVAVGGALDDPATAKLVPGESGGENGVTITRHEDGTVGVTIEHEGQQASGGTNAATSISVSYSGAYCPGADGRFDATVHVKRSVAGTSGGVSSSRTVELKARMQGVLGENAFPEEIASETTQQTTETDTDGTERYITTMQKTEGFTERGVDWGGLDPDTHPPTRLGSSPGLSAAAAERMTADGQLSANSVLSGLYLQLYQLWTDGGCVTLVADIPDRVAPASVSDFTIEVHRKLTGDTVEGPLRLSLEGGAKLQPLESVSTGEFRYTAGAAGTRATVVVASTSRQGGAKASLPVTVGFEGWEVDGTAAGIHVHGGLCPSAWAGWNGRQDILTWSDDGRLLAFRHYPDGNNVTGSVAPDGASGPSGGDGGDSPWQLQTDASGQPAGITAQLNYISTSTGDVFTASASLKIYPATRDIVCDSDGTAHFDRFQ